VADLGLESLWAPKLVRETVCEDRKGEKILLMTGRDGRILWKGTSKKLESLKPGSSQFASPWKNVMHLKRKGALLSRLTHSIVSLGLPEKAIKPLIRFAQLLHWMQYPHAKQLARHITTLCSRNSPDKVGRTAACYHLRLNPRVKSSVKVQDNSIAPGVMVPLWEWSM